MSGPIRTAVALTAAATALTALTACGSGGTGAAGSGAKGGLPKVAKDAGVAAAVPAAIKKKGTLTVVMSTSSPPAHFESEGGVMQGLDADLAVVIGQVMGLKTKVQGVPLDEIIPGLQAKRYDVVVSQFSPTPERAKVVDFVDYAKSGTTLGVPGGNPKKLSMNGLCGVRIGVQKGSSQTMDVVPAIDKKCRAQGKKPVTMMTFKDSSAALLALRSNRTDGVLLDAPVLGYAVKQEHGKLAAAGTVDAAPVAIGAVKGGGMAEPIQKALEKLAKTGAYDKVFARWGLRSTELTPGKFAVNDIKDD